MKGRRKFSKEYKVEALRLAEQRGARAASESLGINISLIYNWKKAVESDGAEAFRGNGNRTALEEENRQLRLENLRQEAEILKKCMVHPSESMTFQSEGQSREKTAVMYPASLRRFLGLRASMGTASSRS